MLVVLAAVGAVRADTTKDAATVGLPYLDALVGRWDMRGTVLGKAARYDPAGELVGASGRPGSSSSAPADAAAAAAAADHIPIK